MGGGDKCLRPLGGRPILDHVVERARPQVDALVLNANGDPDRFAAYGLPVLADTVAGFAGPLAGILTGLEWAAAHRPGAPGCSASPPTRPSSRATSPPACSPPSTAEGAELACAASAGQAHPVFGLWPVALAPELRRALVEEDMRKIDAWTARYRLATVDFPLDPIDPFFNTNRPEDLAEAERLLALRP